MPFFQEFPVKNLRPALFASLSLALLAVAGCDVYVAHDRPRRVYVQPQPVYVEPEPAYIVLRQAPPPIIIEARPSAPSSAHLWIEGSWNWDNQRYVWLGGRYALPPQPDVVWVAARYESSSDGVRYTAGRWSSPRPAPGNGNNGNGSGRGRGRGN
jgi:hypothetical protein